MSKHTAGPWRIAENGKDAATFHIWRNDPEQPEPFRNLGYASIAKHVHGKANANLIAAAPRMLETLKLVTPMAESLMQELRNEKAANWDVINDCLVAVAKAIREATREG